jgi:hypothetical protein
MGIQERQLLFEEFGGDFIQRTRRNSGGNAQFLGFGKHLFALYSKFFC